MAGVGGETMYGGVTSNPAGSNSGKPEQLVQLEQRIGSSDVSLFAADEDKGKAVLQEYLDKYNITVDVNTVGLAKSTATTLAINLNKASKAMSDLGANDRELDNMWHEVCKAAMGTSGAPVKFDGVVTNGVTNATSWMVRWCANGLHQYQSKIPYSHLFIFDYETGYAVAIGYQALRAQNSGSNTYNVAIGYNAGENI